MFLPLSGCRQCSWSGFGLARFATCDAMIERIDVGWEEEYVVTGEVERGRSGTKLVAAWRIRWAPKWLAGAFEDNVSTHYLPSPDTKLY